MKNSISNLSRPLDPEGLTTGAVANLFGISKQKLKSWEKRGIVSPEIDIIGWRFYGEEEIRKLEKHTGKKIENLKKVIEKQSLKFENKSISENKEKILKSRKRNKRKKEYEYINSFCWKVGIFLRKLRKSKNLHLKDLAEWTGVAASRLSDLEKGNPLVFKIDRLLKLSKFYNIPFLEIFGDQDISMIEKTKKRIEKEKKIIELRGRLKKIKKRINIIKNKNNQMQIRIEESCLPEEDKCKMCFIRYDCKNIKS